MHNSIAIVPFQKSEIRSQKTEKHCTPTQKSLLFRLLNTNGVLTTPKTGLFLFLQSNLRQLSGSCEAPEAVGGLGGVGAFFIGGSHE